MKIWKVWNVGNNGNLTGLFIVRAADKEEALALVASWYKWPASVSQAMVERVTEVGQAGIIANV